MPWWGWLIISVSGLFNVLLGGIFFLAGAYAKAWKDLDGPGNNLAS